MPPNRTVHFLPVGVYYAWLNSPWQSWYKDDEATPQNSILVTENYVIDAQFPR